MDPRFVGPDGRVRYPSPEVVRQLAVSAHADPRLVRDEFRRLATGGRMPAVLTSARARVIAALRDAGLLPASERVSETALQPLGISFLPEPKA